MTVTVPQPPADQVKRQEQHDQQQVDIQAAQLAISSRQLTVSYVLAAAQILTLFFLGWQAHETGKAADAASASTEIASKSLVLLNRPYLDAQNWRLDWHTSAYMGGDLRHMAISFDITNPGGVSARIDAVTLHYGIGDSVKSFTQNHYQVIPPQAAFPVEVLSVPSEPSMHEQIMSDAGLMIRVWGRIDYSHRLDEVQHWKTFGRFCVIRYAHEATNAEFLPIEAKGFNTEDGWIEPSQLADPINIYQPRIDPQIQVRRREEARQRDAERRAAKEAEKNKKA